MKTPLRVFAVIPHTHTASFYYRLEVPLRTADDLGLPISCVIDQNDAGVNPEERYRLLCESDLMMMYQPVGQGPTHNIRTLQSFLPSKRDGQWKWAPTTLIETDDNLFNLSPLNHAFKNLGIRDMDGNDIPLGHHIGVVENGQKKVLWKDGEDGFSLARNRQVIASYRGLLNMVDAVSCSTPGVMKAVLKETTPRRIKVWPNLVRFNDYEQVSVRDDGRINILWQGGVAHYEDWYPLQKALGNITRKYSRVHWHFWGAHFHWVTQEVPADRYSTYKFCPYQEYKLRLAMMNHDIALAPLSSNVFNDCRSAIKLYEASVLKKDIPLVAQDTAAYHDEIVDGQTGMLFKNPEEFEAKLSLLIEDETLRRTIGRNAKDWVHENRDAMKNVPAMFEWWQEMRAERRLEQPHVTDAEWARIEEEARLESEEVVPA